MSRMAKTSTKLVNPADWVIQQFGGVRATARALNLSPSSVSRWRTNTKSPGEIPREQQKPILAVAAQDGLDILASDLIMGRVVA